MMQQLETATKSQAKHAQDTCSRNKITCSTKTHTQACKSRACNLITASGKQASNRLRGAACPKDKLEFKLSLSSGGIQTPPFHYFCKVSNPPPFQYCCNVSKPCLYNIVSRYPNITFPILFQGIQTPPFQYCFKISKPPFQI